MTSELQQATFNEWEHVKIDAVTVYAEAEKSYVVVIPVAWNLREGPDWGDVNALIGALAGRAFLSFYDSQEGQRIRAEGKVLSPHIGHHKLQYVNAHGIEVALKQCNSDRPAIGIVTTKDLIGRTQIYSEIHFNFFEDGTPKNMKS